MFLRLLFVFLMVFTAALKAQSLIIGIVAYNPPFSMNADKTHFFGFDIELITELCNQIRVPCKFKPMEFDGLFTNVNEGTIDLGIAAITITKKRQQAFLFSLPYLASKARFVTAKDNSITSLKKLNNKTIGIIRGSLFKQLISQKFKTNSIKEYSSTNQLITALNQHEVDALLMDDFSADYWIANSSSLFKGLGKPFPVGIGYGIIAKMGSTVLVNQINKALKHIEKNGLYLLLYQKYFQTIPPGLI